MDNCSGIAVFQNNTTTLTTFTVFEESNRSLAPPWHAIFVVAYTIVFLVAISLNILMVLTACRKIRGERKVNLPRRDFYSSRYPLNLCVHFVWQSHQLAKVVSPFNIGTPSRPRTVSSFASFSVTSGFYSLFISQLLMGKCLRLCYFMVGTVEVGIFTQQTM